MIVPAITRGVTRYCTGLTAIVESASICSVMRIEPSSVAMPAPARAATTIEVNTGASSRVTRDAERGADEALGAELPQRRGQLQREDHADEQADHRHDQERLHADELHRLEEHADAKRPLEQPAHRRAEQRDEHTEAGEAMVDVVRKLG